MALPTLLRKLFKNDGYGSEIKDENLSLDVTVQDWSASHDYSINTIVKSGGFVYRAAAVSGPGTAAGAVNPANDSQRTYWVGLTSFSDMEYYVQNQGYALDSNVVHKTGDEDIYGYKSFRSSIALDLHEFSGENPFIWGSTSEISTNVYPTTSKFFGGFITGNTIDGNWIWGLLAWGSHDRFSVGIRNYVGRNTGVYINQYYSNGSGGYGSVSFRPEVGEGTALQSGIVDLGAGSLKWKNIYAINGTIQTSDERLKSSISLIPDEVLDAWGSVGFVQFQLNDALKDKGENARLHSGLIAQRIDAAFKNAGLDASRYGLFCYDEWEAEPERRDDSGKVVSPPLLAGNQYSIRYEEALCMEAAYQRRRAERAEARISALEARLAALEAKLNG